VFLVFMDSALTQKLAAIQERLQAEFSTIRTGQATPALLDGVRVMSYGAPMPLNQVATVGIEDARTLRIAPWDTGQVSAIETAIRDADLGVSVMSDSAGVRVKFPELTAERREQLSKLAKAKLEEARVAVRGARDEEMKRLDAAHKAGDLSEDERFAGREEVQKAVDAANQTLEAQYLKKDAELRK
jgi:ribosome recycling factor